MQKKSDTTRAWIKEAEWVSPEAQSAKGAVPLSHREMRGRGEGLLWSAVHIFLFSARMEDGADSRGGMHVKFFALILSAGGGSTPRWRRRVRLSLYMVPPAPSTVRVTAMITAH